MFMYVLNGPVRHMIEVYIYILQFGIEFHFWLDLSMQKICLEYYLCNISTHI